MTIIPESKKNGNNILFLSGTSRYVSLGEINATKTQTKLMNCEGK